MLKGQTTVQKNRSTLVCKRRLPDTWSRCCVAAQIPHSSTSLQQTISPMSVQSPSPYISLFVVSSVSKKCFVQLPKCHTRACQFIMRGEKLYRRRNKGLWQTHTHTHIPEPPCVARLPLCPPLVPISPSSYLSLSQDQRKDAVSRTNKLHLLARGGKRPSVPCTHAHWALIPSAQYAIAISGRLALHIDSMAAMIAVAAIGNASSVQRSTPRSFLSWFYSSHVTFELATSTHHCNLWRAAFLCCHTSAPPCQHSMCRPLCPPAFNQDLAFVLRSV